MEVKVYSEFRFSEYMGLSIANLVIGVATWFRAIIGFLLISYLIKQEDYFIA